MFGLEGHEGWHCPGGTQNGRSVHFTQIGKWSHRRSLSLNSDGWMPRQMLSWLPRPEIPLLVISFHTGKLCPFARLQGDYESWNGFHKPQMKIIVVFANHPIYLGNRLPHFTSTERLHIIGFIPRISVIPTHTFTCSPSPLSPGRNWNCWKIQVKSGTSYSDEHSAVRAKIQSILMLSFD